MSTAFFRTDSAEAGETAAPYLISPKWTFSGTLFVSRSCRLVAGPRLAGSVQERKAQTSFFAGVNSRACTGVLAGSTVVLHWLTQLLTSVLPLGRRVAIWNPAILYPGTSPSLSSHTVWPLASTSTTSFL